MHQTFLRFVGGPYESPMDIGEVHTVPKVGDLVTVPQAEETFRVDSVTWNLDPARFATTVEVQLVSIVDRG